MSGMHTNQNVAILDTKRGINIDCFPTMQDLARQACYSVWLDFVAPSSDPNAAAKNGEHFEGVYARHVAWIRSIADDFEVKHALSVEADKNPTPSEESDD